MKKKAIVIGATGLIGEILVQNLLKNNAYQKVIVVVRRSIGIQHAKLEEKINDYANVLEDLKSLQGDELFCCIGTTIKKAGSKEAFEKVDLDIPANFAKLAAQNGITKMLVVSSLGANLHTSNFYLKTKAQMEHAVGKNLIETVVFFRPSLLLGSRKEFRFGEKLAMIFMPLFNFVLLGGWRKYRAIKAVTVAKAMINVANSDMEGLFYLESDKVQSLGTN